MGESVGQVAARKVHTDEVLREHAGIGRPAGASGDAPPLLVEWVSRWAFEIPGHYAAVQRWLILLGIAGMLMMAWGLYQLYMARPSRSGGPDPGSTVAH